MPREPSAWASLLMCSEIELINYQEEVGLVIGVFQKFLLNTMHQGAGLALMKTKDGFAVVAERNGVRIKGSLIARFSNEKEVLAWQSGLSHGRAMTHAAIVAEGLKRLGVAK